mmetsp:Transcript_13821/g.21174  ORF Transcript_13821/g.21174 Transcript_13821/m.21174 type:complete len:390 (+) Transcript_13821:181-1350(+)|eukprot:CAMPEP_0196825556 /NCGR_PEP_ID=MMETSP1362-20130617/93118_1 /TAXON_ID=163516 /ORGANISM="Leptocylindrus danicus, Strain CCMP1856" /LENGTH=389 /DNA_ID=CAMNT_0042205997 /DNA_START=183 /DNA_END=1352 /DNA_ORIENTATION=+
MASAAAASNNLRNKANRQESQDEASRGDDPSLTTDTDNETGRPLLEVHPSVDGFRRRLKTVVESERFQTAVIALIALNSVFMGINTYLPDPDDTNADKVGRDAAEAINRLDYIFLIIFTIELALNIFVYMHGFIKDGWLVFDFLTIVLSWAFSGMTIIRSFRIFRAFRLFGRVPSLKKIIKAIASTAEGMMSIVFVLFILFYIFAVMFTQLFSECYDDNCYCAEWEDPSETVCLDKGINYFGRLDLTFFTLMMLMTMDDWYTIIKETQTNFVWAWFPIILFMLISGLVMLNLVIAVLCEALAELSDHEDEISEKHKWDEKEYKVSGVPVSNFSVMEGDELRQLFDDLYDEVVFLRERDEETDAVLEYMTDQVTMLEKLVSQVLEQSTES